MRVTLIEPAMIKTPTFTEKPQFLLPPLTIAVLAALSPTWVNLDALDDRVDAIDYDAPRDLVGISVKTYTARRAYEIAREFRARGIPVVLGGHHPTLLPEEAAQHADALVTGEAEPVWHRLLDDARAGHMGAHYHGPPTGDFGRAAPDFSVLDLARYLPVTMIETTRGCPFACSFCSVTTFFGRGFRHRPPADILAEIERQPAQLYFFVDDNIVANKRAAKALFRALIPLNIRWVSQASLTMTRDAELMELMRASGCAGVLVGIESINRENLAQIDKSWNTVGIGYASALQIARDHGVAIIGSFLLGMDSDTPKGLEATLEFAQEHKLFGALFNLLTPYPGTALYDEMNGARRLKQPRWWLDPEFKYGRLVFEPQRMPAADVEAQRMKLYRSFYGPRSVARRMRDRKANAKDLRSAAAYVALNVPAFRQEKRRFGQSLGADRVACGGVAPRLAA